MFDVRRPMCRDLGEEEVVIGIGGHEDKFLKTVNDAGLDELEEDVVATLVRLLVGHTGLLEKVDINEATGKLSHVVEVDSDEFTKARRVVISDSFGVAIGLQNWVGVDNPVLKIRFLDLVLGRILGLFTLRGTKDGKVGDDLLGVLGLSGSRLAGNQHGLRRKSCIPQDTRFVLIIVIWIICM